MLKIMEAFPETPIRFVLSENTDIKPGTVAQLNDVDVVVSDGTRPFGLFGDMSVTKDDILMIDVWSQRFVFRTNNYDKTNSYKTGDSLYVNENGLLTNKKPNDNSLYVAKVISVTDIKKQVLEALWL